MGFTCAIVLPKSSRNAGLLPLAQMYGIFPDHRLLTIWPRFLLLGTWVSMLFLYAACV
jgi:hypothetical protein